jgi:hypothetical protein
MNYGGQAYQWDWQLMRGLGLRTNFDRDWTDVGTIEVVYTTVKVEVSALPAQFCRFTITRSDGEVVTVSTGSGGFGRYWPLVEQYAVTGQWSDEARRLHTADMFVIEPKP